MEGQTESIIAQIVHVVIFRLKNKDIVAAGVYYLDVGDLEGGNLKFRPAVSPESYDCPLFVLYSTRTDFMAFQWTRKRR